MARFSFLPKYKWVIVVLAFLIIFSDAKTDVFAGKKKIIIRHTFHYRFRRYTYITYYRYSRRTSSKPNPCNMAWDRIRDIRNEENEARYDVESEKRKELSTNEFNKWYHCEEASISLKMFYAAKGYEGRCVGYCKDTHSKRCEQRYSAMLTELREDYEHFKNICPDHPMPKQTKSQEKDAIPGRNTMTFHE